MRRHLSAALVTVVLLGAATACSSDGTTAPDTTAAATPDAATPDTATTAPDATTDTAATDTAATDTAATDTAATDTAATDTAATDTASAAKPTAPRFLSLNPAVGYGLLRVMALEERPDPLNVVIYETLPNELSRVAGVITGVAQTPLSHVNLRAVQDKVPNAYVADVLDDPKVAALVGKYVRYEVTRDGFTIEPATQAQVEAHHAAARPASPQTPRRDLSVKEIRPLSEVGFEDWTAFGVKAANVATLRTIGLPEGMVPDGWAVPSPSTTSS